MNRQINGLKSFRRAAAAVATAIALTLAALHADVRPAPLFGDDMVLQRDLPVPVWGSAEPGEKVTVTFGAQSVSTLADASGQWRVSLAPLAASREPAELVIAGKSTVLIRNVVVGDVWLCSGQSNMELPVRRTKDAKQEIASADFPLIRQFAVKHTVGPSPAATVEAQWAVCQPATVAEFSAVAFYFGRQLHRQLGVPIGLLHASWGGTPIESWMSRAALKSDPAFAPVFTRWADSLAASPGKQAAYEAALEKWKKDGEAARAAGKKFNRRAPARPEGEGSRFEPAGLYNGMIAPLVPAAIRGVIWYQGENNAPRYAEYARLFGTMIQQWRYDFKQPALPFYFVQLANLQRKTDPTDREWAFQREAQAKVLALPHTGMAVTIDIGDPNNIHPTNKQDVGRRLALVALADTYGRTEECSGPRLAGMKRDKAALRLTFTHAAGLRSADPDLPGFELAGPDHGFYPATARIEGESIVVRSDRVPEPVAVRYAWHNAPPAPLYNGADLPAAPFRSDNW